MNGQLHKAALYVCVAIFSFMATVVVFTLIGGSH